MKKILVLLLAFLILISISACSSEQADDNRPVGGEDQPVGEGIKTQAILFDFSCGSPEENIRRETHYSYQDITAEEIIEMMSDISGLDFFATVSMTVDGIVVDWAADSTLVAGLDDREQKEDFFFYDAESLRWFMMDSMYQTMKDLFLVEEIYYTMDGGKELMFDELYPVNSFPSDLPYMGSAFFFAHANEADIESDDQYEDGEESISEDEAMDILVSALDMAEETAVVAYGKDMVNGVHCWTFAYGKNTPEKFTAETHYAVTGDGRILVLDFASGEYIETDSP